MPERLMGLLHWPLLTWRSWHHHDTVKDPSTILLDVLGEEQCKDMTDQLWAKRSSLRTHGDDGSMPFHVSSVLDRVSWLLV